MLMVHFYHHLDSHREEDGDIKCEKCNSEAQDLLRKFSRTDSTVHSLTCLFCKKSRFSNVSQFKVHLWTHRLQTSVCSNCGCLSISFQTIVYYLQSQASLKRISPVHANGTKNIQCESCGRIFQKLHLLEIHLLSHISDPLFCCRNCKEVFRNGRLYMMHMKKCMRRKTLPSSDEILSNSSGIIDETFDCPYCKLCFSSPSQLQRHLPLHLAVKESKSETESADDDFMTKDETDTRMNSNPIYTSTFVCPNCGQVFKEKEELGVHLKTDCPLDYNCKHCFKVFSRWSDLEQHIKYHNCNKSRPNSLDQRLYERLQLSEYEVRHLSSKQLYRCSQCYKSFVSNTSLDTHAKLHLAGTVLSSGKDPNKIASNCSPSYADSGNRKRSPEKEKINDDNCKSLSDRRGLCDVCGEVFLGLVDLNHHMKMHNCQEVCEPIYTMANINNSRQPDIYPNQPPLMMFPPHNSLSTPCILPGPDMNSNFTRIGNMIPGTHASSFSTVQTNVSVPTFASSANVIPFIPSVNELKNVPYSDFVPPGLPFHVQNIRGSFFPIPSFDNRTSESNLSYGDCRDKLSSFPYNDCNRFNVFYSVPAQEEVSLSNVKDNNSNQERNGSITTFICENRDKIISPLASATQNNVNLGTVPQKINTDIPRSISDYQTNTVFLPEKENFVPQLSSKSNLGANMDTRPFPVSFSTSKNTNFISKSQNTPVESGSTKTNTNNIENQNLEYPANEILINLPNLSQGSNFPGHNLPEIEPLNLCQTRNLGDGKFYNYPIGLDSKAFLPQQTSLSNLNNTQATYPVPLFWEESKSDFDMNFNIGNQCSNDGNDDTLKFSSEFQNENIQSPLWSEPKTYYTINQVSFRDRNYDDVNGKVGKISTNKPSFSAFSENRSKNINSSLYENQNSVSENEPLKTANSHVEHMQFLRLKPNYTFSNSISSTGNVCNSNKDSVGSDTSKSPKYQDHTLITARDHCDVDLMPNANSFASNQTGAGST